MKDEDWAGVAEGVDQENAGAGLLVPEDLMGNWFDGMLSGLFQTSKESTPGLVILVLPKTSASKSLTGVSSKPLIPPAGAPKLMRSLRLATVAFAAPRS